MVDRVQERIGSVKDIIIVLGERFPKVSGLLLESESEKKRAVLLIAEIDLLGKQFVSTHTTKNRLPLTFLRENEVLLMRDVIDQQVVDLDGARVIRVNDLKLAKVDQDVRLTAADVGLAGMLRRLSIEKPIAAILSWFNKKIPEQLIGWDHVQNLKGGIISIPSKTITDLHPADVAHIISQVKTDEKTAIFSSLSEKTAAESLHELEPLIGAMLLQTVDTKRALSILEKMPVDEAADIIGDLPPERGEDLLRLMKVRKSSEIRKLLMHRDESAGGLMTTAFVSFPQSMTVGQVISKLRETAPEAETIYYIYLTDEAERLVGILSLKNLIISPPEKIISDIMIKDVMIVSPEINQREVAAMISKYNLFAVPVVDSEKKMLGIITVDDVIDYVIPPISRRKRQMLG